ncbi:hypothetical protein CYMTET_25853 [Cymbomonas tetramitiformis]|uniref:C2H2-type domain-containing protein n=1 Tax=Cymbomonas tetramitiformis TaxID=36881 RepID=A0AAE0FTD5_9CHLO|nr:hypothetical protein CYMTET_25853 [Cymbomonas tetramitiformis]
MGKAPHNRNKGTKGKKGFKVAKRAHFEARHIDQVWEDVRKEEPVHDGTHGPQGTTARVAHDEDVAGLGQFYCIPCSKYFQNAFSLESHERTKPHKKRLKVLKGERPHSREDAEACGGMGKPDNGPPLTEEIQEMGF